MCSSSWVKLRGKWSQSGTFVESILLLVSFWKVLFVQISQFTIDHSKRLSMENEIWVDVCRSITREHYALVFIMSLSVQIEIILLSTILIVLVDVCWSLRWIGNPRAIRSHLHHKPLSSNRNHFTLDQLNLVRALTSLLWVQLNCTPVEQLKAASAV